MSRGIRIWRVVSPGERLPDGFMCDIQGASHYLGVSTEQLRRHVLNKTLPATKERSVGREGFRWTFTTEDLNHFADSLDEGLEP